jgi:hypothetical protein
MKLPILFAISSIFLSSPVLAEEYNKSFTTSARIINICLFKVGNINFGSYQVNSDNFASTDIDVICTAGSNYTLGINYYYTGTSAALFKENSNKFAVMSNGAWNAVMFHTNKQDTLMFNLFKDPSHTQIFGDSQTPNYNWSSLGPQVSVNKQGNGFIQKTPIYAASVAGQRPRTGTYSITYAVNIYF